jgi:DNA-binding MarR family transcriptional regulator
MADTPRIDGNSGPVIRLDRLSDAMGFLLRMSQLMIYDHFYATLGAEGLRPGEYVVLYVIRNNPRIKQGLLGQTLSIKPAHMTKTVRRLETQGMLTREIPDNDRRSVLLTLSPQGQAFVAEHEERFFGSNVELTQSLSEEETVLLAKILRKFCGIQAEDAP